MAEHEVLAFPWLAAVPETAEGERTTGFAKVQEYLERFGYLATDGVAVGELDGGTHAALLRFQRFFGLEETGEFDEPTRHAMMQPRCSHPDPEPDDVGFATTCAWERTDLTFALDTGTTDIAGDAEWTAIRNAFRSWQALGVLTFREVGINDNPDIRVGWRPAADPDHSMVGGVLAHADFPPRCGVVTNQLPKPLHFDDTEHVWSIGAVANAFDVETVALHEIGHLVGLAHSSVAGAVMLPTVSANLTKRSLTQDDIDGYNRLYPRPAGPWSGWNSQGGVLTSRITVARNADGRLEAFVRGTDGALWHKWQITPNGSWSGWNSQGGVLTSDIAVARNADGRLEVFVRGTDNALWHKWQTTPNGSWSGWSSQGGVLTSNIAAGRNADGRLEVFVRGTDNAMWHKWQTTPNGNWSGWSSQGGVLTSDIAVERNADGRLEAFVRGTDNAMWHKWQTTPNGNWSGWNSQGGVLTSPISVAANADGRLEAFVRGTDGAMWHKWQNVPNGAWSGWASQGGVLTSNIALGRNASGRLEAFVRGTDNALWHKWQTVASGGPWSGWASRGGVLTSDPAVASNQDGRLEVFVRGTDNALWHMWQTQPFLTTEQIVEYVAEPAARGQMPVGNGDRAGTDMPRGDMVAAAANGMPAGAMDRGAADGGEMPAGAMAGGDAAAGMPGGGMGSGGTAAMPGGSMPGTAARPRSKRTTTRRGAKATH